MSGIGIIWRCPKYVRYCSDSDENEIIDEMKRNSKNIVPAFMIDVNNPEIITAKIFDGENLVIVPENELSLQDKLLVQKLKKISYWQIHKSRIQRSNEPVVEKSRLCEYLEKREFPNDFPPDKQATQTELEYLKTKLQKLAPNVKKRQGID